MVVVNQADPARSKHRIMPLLELTEVEAGGCPKLMRRGTTLDPAQGFLQDDVLQLQVELVC